MRLKLGLLIIAGVLLAAASARADCCSSWPEVSVGSNGCNIFGCNCSGPCSNFGHTCANGPIKMDSLKGECPGYQWCMNGGFCGPNAHCIEDGRGNSGCHPNNPSLAQGAKHSSATRSPIVMTSAAQRAAAAERFQAIDGDKDGRLSFAEVKAWAAKNGIQLSDSELKKKFDEVDANKNGVIHPAEFDKPANPPKK